MVHPNNLLNRSEIAYSGLAMPNAPICQAQVWNLSCLVGLWVLSSLRYLNMAYGGNSYQQRICPWVHWYFCVHVFVWGIRHRDNTKKERQEKTCTCVHTDMRPLKTDGLVLKMQTFLSNFCSSCLYKPFVFFLHLNYLCRPTLHCTFGYVQRLLVDCHTN